MELSQTEINLLRELEGGPRTISDNDSRAVLKRLMDSGWVSERSLNMSVTEYEITAAGRAALGKLVSDNTIPVEDLNASNDE